MEWAKRMIAAGAAAVGLAAPANSAPPAPKAKEVAPSLVQTTTPGVRGAEVERWGGVVNPFGKCSKYTGCPAEAYEMPRNVTAPVPVEPDKNTHDILATPVGREVHQTRTAIVEKYKTWGDNKAPMYVRLDALISASVEYRRLEQIGTPTNSSITGVPSYAEMDRTIAAQGIAIAERYAST